MLTAKVLVFLSGLMVTLAAPVDDPVSKVPEGLSNGGPVPSASSPLPSIIPHGSDFKVTNDVIGSLDTKTAAGSVLNVEADADGSISPEIIKQFLESVKDTSANIPSPASANLNFVHGRCYYHAKVMELCDSGHKFHAFLQIGPMRDDKLEIFAHPRGGSWVEFSDNAVWTAATLDHDFVVSYFQRESTMRWMYDQCLWYGDTAPPSECGWCLCSRWTRGPLDCRKINEWQMRTQDMDCAFQC
ncbi:hypothetical protein P154DRAFT_576540 [Amniculicola lignicola CBS 123094]|uniref:Uncharacterized protein n=1 Tax=Amniculicola lignicola CBS 123094 TaxID=1392246 RepID=A0A6A5WGI2_9PLEO|nr:hypothetical protein P154DRAFT_576540 [Amniculicola lignicola CBS 123094]